MLIDIIVVSDIDDTIKWSHILGPEVLGDGLNYHLAFRGMPELYTSLASAGAKVTYVTGAPDVLIAQLEINSLPQKVVSTNHFPHGDIFLHKLGESTEDFKVATITKIMKDAPASDFILIGDNGEKDIETYTRIRQDPEVGSRVKEVFIHKIYNGGSSLEPKADQHPFVTAADLAAMLYGLNFLTGEDLAAIVKIVDEGMNDTGQNRNLTLPLAAQLVPAQIDAIYASLPKTIDPPTQAFLDDIHQLMLQQAERGPRRF
jgi:hypothetical protein